MAFALDNNNDDGFELDDGFVDSTRLVVIGVGGGGGNAVSYMTGADNQGDDFDVEEIEDIDFVVANTDVKALRSKDAKKMKRIQLGRKRTRGQGAGNDPTVGQEAAVETEEELRAVMDNVSMVFVAAGMGGGTGTGAAPVVASIAKEKKILTVGVVTKPFNWEGQEKMSQAMRGIDEMRKYVDALIVIPNEKVKEVSKGKFSAFNAFKIVNSVLYKAVRGISELVRSDGYMNVDFADVTTMLTDSGVAHMAMGTGKGDDKIQMALNEVINSPLLETSISGARRILVNISIPVTFPYEDYEYVSNEVTKNLAPNAKVKAGMCIDKTLEDDEIKIIVIATDFSGDDRIGDERMKIAFAQEELVQGITSLGDDTSARRTSATNDSEVDALLDLFNSK